MTAPLVLTVFHMFKFVPRFQGELNLANTEVIEENKKYNEKQIFIVSFNGEYNLLMEAESADDADDWIIEIRDHIKFANSDAAEPDTTESAKARALKAQSMKVPNARYEYAPLVLLIVCLRL